jgi:hypothetical protein
LRRVDLLPPGFFINGFEIELTRFVKSSLPLFAKQGESLPLKKGGAEGFSESALKTMILWMVGRPDDRRYASCQKMQSAGQFLMASLTSASG